jgi:hypothetical protein
MQLLLSIIYNIEKQFAERTFFEKQSRVFLNALYIIVVFKCVCWCFQFEVLFGNENGIYKGESALPLLWKSVFLIYTTSYSSLKLFFILLLFLGSMTALLSKRSIPFLHLLLWFLLINLHNALYISLSGGDYLLQQLVLCSLFLKKESTLSLTNARVLYNLSALALVLQISFMYVTAGITKLMNVDWLNGDALYYILQVSDFNTFDLQLPNLLLKISSYSIVAYQLSFPVFIWIKPIKRPFLWLGASIHLFIAVGLGLFAFGLISLLPYLLFYERRSDLK